jgi:hypothetical protein
MLETHKNTAPPKNTVTQNEASILDLTFRPELEAQVESQNVKLEEVKATEDYSYSGLIERNRQLSTQRLIVESLSFGIPTAALTGITVNAIINFVQGIMLNPPIIQTNPFVSFAAMGASACCIGLWSTTAIPLAERFLKYIREG